jgi:16S rRNA (adenine1518-N6/adenine1519-N6)-dimethyltransferase
VELLEETRKICKLYDINPARSKGQNFLVNEDVYDKIIESADLGKDDLVLEVGPGLGFLTEKLAQKVKKVLSVELDDKLAELLKIRLLANGIKNVEIINQDIIELLNSQEFKELDEFKKGSYKIVANLPYNISSIFLRTVFELPNKPKSLTLMLQKEVAERIVAKPGKMSLLAVSVQLYADSLIVTNVSGRDICPVPDVESSVIHLELKKDKMDVDEKRFFQLVKFGFSAKRKMLKNNLVNGFRVNQKEIEEKIVKAGFSLKIRAQELSVEDWKKLLKEF